MTKVSAQQKTTPLTVAWGAWRSFLRTASFAQKMMVWATAHAFAVLLMLMCAKWAAIDTESRLTDLQWAFAIQKPQHDAAPLQKTWAQSAKAHVNTQTQSSDLTWARALHKDQRAPWESAAPISTGR